MTTSLISASEFKAKCLALLSDTEEHGTTITITRRGQPIAQLVPIQSRPRVSMAGALAGKVRIPDDLLNEDRSVLWTVNSGE